MALVELITGVRKARYTLSLVRLAETAGKIGAIGLPILEIAAKVSALV